jgi:hypothetical protein
LDFRWKGDRKEINEMIGRRGRILKIGFLMDSVWHKQNLVLKNECANK